MTIQEKIENLTPEQREKLQTVKTEQELDAFLAESGIEPTAEERAMLSEHLKAKTGELTDDELAEAAGGSNFDKCPKGHYEATGFASFFVALKDCDKCYHFRRYNEREKLTGYCYDEYCSFFERERTRTYTERQ